MLRIQIGATGKTLEELEYALEDIIQKFADGFTSGSESGDAGSYTFSIDGDEEEVTDGAPDPVH